MDMAQIDMMSLPYEEFDQQIDPPGGWRIYAKDRPEIAVSLLEDYLDDNEGNLTEDQRDNLTWHIGQLLAVMDKSEAAVRYMRKSIKYHDNCWNLYVGATVAFLEGNRKNFDILMGEMEKDAGELCKANLPVVKRLSDNWGKPYKEAY